MLVMSFLLCFQAHGQDINPLLKRIASSNVVDGVFKANVEMLISDTRVGMQGQLREAAYLMREYPSLESKTLVLFRLEKELKRDKPNTVVACGMLHALEVLGSAKDTETLRSLREMAAEKLTGKRWETVRVAFSAAESKFALRADELPSLFENATQTIAPRPVFEDLPTYSELIATIRDAGVLRIAKRFPSLVKQNVYDRSVQILGQPDSVTGRYYGRERQLRQMSNALQRREKGHFFLPGKAGVGKTTLIEMFQMHYLQKSLNFPGEEAPLVFKVPILTIVSRDPSDLELVINDAQKIAHALHRHFVLFSDEAHASSDMIRQALKDFLTEPLDEETTWSTWLGRQPPVRPGNRWTTRRFPGAGSSERP